MADLYYIDSGYLTPDTGYYTYIADGAATPASQFTITCAIGKQQSASVSLSGSVSITVTATKIISASAAFTSAFSPTLSITVFKNSFAVLDSPSVLSATPVVNRSITQTVDTIATLNAMAAKTAVSNSNLSSMAAVSATVTAVKSTSASITSSASLSATADKLKSASASLSSVSSLTTTRYFGMGRPRDGVTGLGSITYSSSVKKFGSHSMLINVNNGLQTRNTDYKLIPAPNTSWALEGWVYTRFASGSTIRYLFSIGDPDSATNYFLKVYTDDSGSGVAFAIRDSSSIIYTGGGTITAGSWNHVLIIKNSSAFSVYLNGSRAYTSSSNLTATYKKPTTGFTRLAIGDIFSSSSVAPYIDDVSFHIGTTLGFDPTASTITVPTSQRFNDPDTTLLLLHFNNDALDDISYTALGEASLASTATLSAAIQKTRTANAALNSVSTVYAIANKTVQAVSDQNSTATVTVTSTRIQNASATLSSLVTESVAGTRAKGFTATLNTVSEVDCKGHVKRNIIDIHLPAVTATMNIDYVRVRSGDSAFTSAFSPTLSVTAQLAGVALLETFSTLSAEAAKTVGISSDLNTAFTQSTNAGRLITAASAVNATLSLNIDYQHLVGVSATANSQFTANCNVSRIRTVNSTQSSILSLTASVSRTRDATASVNSTVTESITVTRIRSGAVTVNSVVSVTAAVTKTARISLALSSAVTQITNTVKTARGIANFSAIATELTAAFKNATGTITMSSVATVTAAIGRIIQLQPNVNSGVRSTGDYFPRLRTDNIPLGGYGPLDRGFTVSIWARRKTTNTYNCLWSAMTQWPTTPTFANWGLIIDNNDVRLRSYFDPDEAGATWSNLAPTDTEWHQYVIQYQGRISNQNLFKLWIDGVDQGVDAYPGLSSDEFEKNRPTFGENSWITIGGNLTRNQVGTYDEAATQDKNIDFAQIWVGEVNTTLAPGTSGLEGDYRPSGFDITEFYDGGYVDLGTSGRGEFNQLPTPYVYNTLTSPWTGVEYYGSTPGTQGAELALTIPTGEVNTELTVEGAIVLVLSANLHSISTVSALGSYRIAQSATVDSASTLSAAIARTRTVNSALASQFTQSATLLRTRRISADLTAQITVSATTGYRKPGAATLSSQVTLACDFIVILPIRATADLTSAFTLNAQVNERQGFIITENSQFTVSCEITVKPPIRITANLTSTVTVTATLSRVQAFSVTLNSLFTVTADTTKIKGIIANLSSNSSLSILAGRRIPGAANLQVQAFELTQGDILNFAPELTLYVTQETRTRRVIPENRLYSIDSESRTRRVLAESRVITIESQTEVNII